MRPYAGADRLAAFALEELEAAQDAVTVSNHEARETLAVFGEPDPTQPARSDAGGTIGDREGRDATEDD